MIKFDIFFTLGKRRYGPGLQQLNNQMQQTCEKIPDQSRDVDRYQTRADMWIDTRPEQRCGQIPDQSRDVDRCQTRAEMWIDTRPEQTCGQIPDQSRDVDRYQTRAEMWIDTRLKHPNTKVSDFTVIRRCVFHSVPVTAHVQGGVWLVQPNLTYKRVSIFNQNKRSKKW